MAGGIVATAGGRRRRAARPRRRGRRHPDRAGRARAGARRDVRPRAARRRRAGRADRRPRRRARWRWSPRWRTTTAGARLRRLLAAAGVEVYPLPLAGATPEKIRLRAGGQTLLRLDRGGGPPRPARRRRRCSTCSRTPAPSWSATTAAGWRASRRCGQALGGRRPRSCGTRIRAARPRCPAPGWRRRTRPRCGRVTGVAAGRREAARRLRTPWRAHAVAVTTGAAGAVLCHAGPTPLVVPSPAAVHGPLDPAAPGTGSPSAAALALAAGALVSEAVQAAVASASAYVAAGGPDSSASAASGAASRGGSRDRRARSAPPTSWPRVRARRRHGGRHRRLLRPAARRARGDARGRPRGSATASSCASTPTTASPGSRARTGPWSARPTGPGCSRRWPASTRSSCSTRTTPHAVLSWLRPDVWVKGGDYAELPEAELVRRWGGETVVVPYLDGRSTTAMISKGAR